MQSIPLAINRRTISTSGGRGAAATLPWSIIKLTVRSGRKSYRWTLEIICCYGLSGRLRMAAAFRNEIARVISLRKQFIGLKIAHLNIIFIVFDK